VGTTYPSGVLEIGPILSGVLVFDILHIMAIEKRQKQ
jgi:hypothetical protein